MTRRPAWRLTLGAGSLLLAACAGTPTAQTAPASSTPAGSTPAGNTRVAPASAWPTASGDAARTSPTTATGPQTGRIAWKRHLEGAVAPGPVVGADGSVLAASNGGVLHALDPADGTDRWTYDGGGSYGSDLSTSSAVLDDGTILWPGPHDRLYGLTSGGRLLWTVQLDGLVLSPAVIGRRAYIADATGTLLALDLPDTGPPRQAWRTRVGGTSYSSPSVGPDGTIYAAADARVTAVRDDGNRARVRWTFRARDIIEVSTAVAADGTVIVGTNNDVQYGLRPDGTVRWTFDRGDWTYSSPVVRDGKTWFGTTSAGSTSWTPPPAGWCAATSGCPRRRAPPRLGPAYGPHRSSTATRTCTSGPPQATSTASRPTDAGCSTRMSAGSSPATRPSPATARSSSGPATAPCTPSTTPVNRPAHQALAPDDLVHAAARPRTRPACGCGGRAWRTHAAHGHFR